MQNHRWHSLFIQAQSKRPRQVRSSQDEVQVSLLSSALASQSLSSPVVTDSVLRVEAYWVMNVIDKNYSFNSCTHADALMKMMFPDSAIAAKFACGERKCSYISTFGLGPHLSLLLKTAMRNTSEYVVLFDESLSMELQEKQLDVHMRLWDAGRVDSLLHVDVFGACRCRHVA